MNNECKVTRKNKQKKQVENLFYIENVVNIRFFGKSHNNWNVQNKL